jgi:hypothetical protein
MEYKQTTEVKNKGNGLFVMDYDELSEKSWKIALKKAKKEDFMTDEEKYWAVQKEILDEIFHNNWELH